MYGFRSFKTIKGLCWSPFEVSSKLPSHNMYFGDDEVEPGRKVYILTDGQNLLLKRYIILYKS